MDVKTHYDLLIEENNDPFRDPPVLQKYMESRDGRTFPDQTEPVRKLIEAGRKDRVHLTAGKLLVFPVFRRICL